MKRLFRKFVTVICCMAIVVPTTAFAKEGGNSNTQEPELINTQEWSINGLTAINIVYESDLVKILPSSSDKIILKEYLTENDSAYYATSTIKDAMLNIKLGSRPTTSYESRIEIYMPADFKGSTNIDVKTGLIEVGNISSSCVAANSTSGLITINNYTGILNCVTKSGIVTINNYSGDLNCYANTGIVKINECVVQGKIQTESGGIDLQLNGINGDLEAISGTGSLTAKILDSIDFNISASTVTGRVTNNFSNAFSTTEKTITGSWGETPINTITLKTNSGFVKIGKK